MDDTLRQNQEHTLTRLQELLSMHHSELDAESGPEGMGQKLTASEERIDTLTRLALRLGEQADVFQHLDGPALANNMQNMLSELQADEAGGSH